MKTLEERLRDAEIVYQCADGDIERSGCVELDDALAIVADAPRIYRGEEILDAPEGDYAMGWIDPDERIFRKFGVSWNGIIKHPSHNTEAWKDRIFVGPLPTNSPIEGKG